MVITLDNFCSMHGTRPQRAIYINERKLAAICKKINSPNFVVFQTVRGNEL